MKENIVVVEDDPEVREVVESHLKSAFFNVELFPDSKQFLDSLENLNPDLIVLDIVLPDGDGLEICKFLKNSTEYAAIPIIMLSAKGKESERILGLEMGADDYMVKPFFPKELVARIKVLLRRREEVVEDYLTLKVGNILEIDTERYIVSVDGKEADLTTTEFKILEMLSRKPGRVYSREQILDHLWGDDKIVIDKTVDVHIKNLRKKIGEAGEFIDNVRGIGYRLSP